MRQEWRRRFEQSARPMQSLDRLDDLTMSGPAPESSEVDLLVALLSDQRVDGGFDDGSTVPQWAKARVASS